MGGCGCGDGFGMFRFPGTDGATYTFNTYPGCENCSTEIGITIQRLKGDMLEWAPADMPTLPFYALDDDLGDFALPMIDPETLAGDLVDVIGSDLTITDPDGEAFTLAELFEDDNALRRALEANMARTIAKWIEDRKEAATC